MSKQLSESRTQNQYLVSIQGMSCASCVGRIEKAVQNVAGVQSVQVNLATEQATVSVQSFAILDSVISAIKQAGYQAQVIVDEKKIQIEENKQRQLKIDLIILIFSMLFTMPLVAPMLLQPFGYLVVPSLEIQIVLASVVQFVFGGRFYKSAFRALKARTGNMDLLVALGTTAAYGLSLFHIYQIWSGRVHATHSESHLYFESSAVIISLILFGKYLEARAKQQTTAAIKALQTLRPEVATVIKNGVPVQVSLDEVRVKDVLQVKAGERIPVDGTVILGSTQVDESLMTGESLPLFKGVGDMVIAGSINSEGLIQVEARAIGAETMLAKIIRLVESAQAAKAPIQRLVDRVSAIFVPIVIFIAAMTILVWGFAFNDWQQAIINGVAVLVIACPCALGLATPTSIIVGTGLAAKNGILIKDPESLEIMHSITTVAFDKTGTLTEGRPSVSFLKTYGVNDEEFLQIAASIQAVSEHPLAKAVVAKARLQNILISPIIEMKTVPGYGVEAKIQQQSYILGNAKMMTNYGLSLESQSESIINLQQNSQTISFLADLSSKKILGIMGFLDPIKSEALQTIQALKKLNIKTIMITGDNQNSAKAVGQKLGIDEVRAEVLPKNKAQEIEKLKVRGEVVAMVGDGINDAPALASAHVGLAMSTGTEVAMHSAGITLMRGNPLLIPDAIEISRRTYEKIRQNLFWAFIYNIVGIPLAALGLMNPMIAGAAMALSSVSVVGNALLLKKWQPKSQT